MREYQNLAASSEKGLSLSMVSSSQKSLAEISHIKDFPIQSPLLSSQDLGWESIVVEEFKQPPGASDSGTYTEQMIWLSC